MFAVFSLPRQFLDTASRQFLDTASLPFMFRCRVSCHGTHFEVSLCRNTVSAPSSAVRVPSPCVLPRQGFG
jgi:hypothetical protein